MSETCKAAWSGGKCSRTPGAARGLCQGHYAQWRRQTDSGRLDVRPTFTELRSPDGEGPTTVPVTVHVSPEARDAYRAAAEASGVKQSELMRPWLEAGYKRYQDAFARAQAAQERRRAGSTS